MRIRVFIDTPETRVPPEAWGRVAMGVCERAGRWFSAMQKELRYEEIKEELREMEAAIGGV